MTKRGTLHRCRVRTAVALLLLTLVALPPASCGRVPATMPETSSAPTLTAAVEVRTTSEAKPVDGPGSVPGRAPPTILSTFETADFSGPGTCTMCHEGLADQAGVDVSLAAAWRSTMMANAAKDPVWQAKVSSEVARFPALQAVIEKKCVSCHMPMGRTQAQVNGQVVAASGGGFFDPTHPLHEAAIEGVSCTLCHQIGVVGLGTMESFSGGYGVDTNTEPPDRQLLGPYEQPLAPPMQMHSGFVPVYAEHTGEAELCATCHNLYTPYVDADGSVVGEFPEQTPYTEWQHSSFGGVMPCQSCHMPAAKGAVVISRMPGRLAPRQPFYQHWFVGGNALMLRILSQWGTELEATADVAHFDATAARVLDQIGERTAALAMESLALDQEVLTMSLKVMAMTGHKFPTGFPSRRAWLHVAVADQVGKVIWESGARSADGSIWGNAADVDPAVFEPHYNLITQPDQVQIYEPIMADDGGQVTYTLLRAAHYLKDNRLLPAGTDKALLPTDVGVYGEAMDDASFVGGSDVVTYEMEVRGATGPFTVSVELLYQPLSYRFVVDLLADETELTERFGRHYRGIDTAPLVVASIEAAVR